MFVAKVGSKGSLNNDIEFNLFQDENTNWMLSRMLR